jgi:uncharacterized membrane protein
MNASGCGASVRDCGWAMTPLPLADGNRRGCLSYVRRRRSDSVATIISRKSLCSFSCLAKHFALGSFSFLTIAALLLSNLAAAMLFLLFGILASLAMLFLWIVLSVKAWQGERFELPLFGQLAARMK